MTKSLVINGLHRSGTTMMERLVDSQESMICFGHLFEILRVLAQMKNVPEKDYIIREDFSSDKYRVTERRAHSLRRILINNLLANYVDIWQHPDFSPGDEVSYHNLEREDIWRLADAIAESEPVSDIAGVLQSIGRKLGVSVVGTKWTHNHNFAPVYLRSPDAYWLEIVRSPYAVYSSEVRGGWDLVWTDFLNKTDAYRFTAEFKHERFLVLRYEDLCDDPDSCLARVSEWIGEEIRNVPLQNPRGGKFKGNSSSNAEEGRSLYFEAPEGHNSVDSSKRDRWREHLTEREKAFLNIAMDFHGLYETEAVGSGARFLGAVDAVRRAAPYLAKRVLNSALSPVGLQLVRSPRDIPL